MEVQITEPVDVAVGLEFEEFFRDEHPRLVRALCLLVANRDEAEELAQAAMARVYERWERVRAMESPGGYVYRTAVNLQRRRLRHLAVRTRRLLTLGGEAQHEPSPELAHELTQALDALSDGQREAFMLVEWLGMTSEEAGRILRIAPGSVRSRVHRARATLRDRLWPEEERHG